MRKDKIPKIAVIRRVTSRLRSRPGVTSDQLARTRAMGDLFLLQEPGLVTAAEWAQQIHHFHLSLSCCWSRDLRSSELRLDLGASTDTHLDIQIYPSSFQCCCPLAFLIQMFKDRLDQFFITHAKYTFLSVSFFVKPET